MGNVSLKLTKVFQRIYYYDSIKSEKIKRLPFKCYYTEPNMQLFLQAICCKHTNIRCLSINKGPILFLYRLCRLDIFSC